ncbi:MAG TPA: hypothetical protein DCS15_04600 [Flavobacteriales bacterium]|jgi:hypothetical protein|nr:hypothetical protein [Salibacteraceae bacterium]HAS35743.1 hypothetical protein [Flavobacteriales bacterium]
MLSFLIKKKISEQQVASHFVHSIIQMVEESFADVAELMNSEPEFETSPNINPDDYDRFMLIVLAGNLLFIPKHFNDYQDVRLTDSILNKLAEAFGLPKDKLKETISNYQKFFSKVNHPSKNIHYAMSKAVFFKYDLNRCQDEYFRNMKTPNPIFLNHMNDIIANYIWDWKSIQSEYKVVS